MPTKVDRRPLISYLRVQRANDRAILDMLRQAANDIELELFASQSKFKLSDRVRTDQLLMAKARINRRMEKLWLDIGDQVQAGKAAAAAAAVEDAYPQAWLKKVMPAEDVEYLMRSARASAERGIDVAEARVNLSRIPLAESVYKNGAHANGIIDEIVNSGLAAGLSAKEIANGVSAFINPNTPGGVKYAAMRLGRTELNNAFHATQVQAGIDTPWTTALKWNLSGSHPVPDECNEYAESVHYEGGEAGVFKPEEVPAKPHPNCLCYTTPETDSEDEFIRKLEAGEYDDYLDEEFGLDPSSRFSSAPRAPRVKDATTTTPAPTKPDVPAQFKDLKTLDEPQGYREAAKTRAANPGTGTSYKNNCHYVVNSMEMRARGYDVVAAPTYKATGRFTKSIAKDWIDPATGTHRKFEFAVPRASAGEKTVRDAVARACDDWPPNSRGFISGDWTHGGGGHIFSVYKDSTGVLKFVDGQVGRVDASNYLDQLKKVEVLRVDDLEPVADRVRLSVENEVEKVSKETQGVRLKNLLDQLREDMKDVGQGMYFQSYVDQADVLRAEAKKLGVQI